MKTWNKKEEELAISLLKENIPYSEISKVLNRTSGSIRLKLQKLGYGFVKEKYIKRICLNCKCEFDITKLNEKIFCSQSCAATFNNKLRNKKHTCLNCKKGIDSWKTYCTKQCVNNHKQKVLFERIENSEIGFSEKQLKRYLISKFGEKCMECDWSRIHPITGKVPVQLEHIDGNSENNTLENLKILCPNCHSLTPTFGSLNKGNGREQRRLKRQTAKSCL
jgi:hypothetical protein